MRPSSARWLYGRTGAARWYVTPNGTVHDAGNAAVAWLDGDQLLGLDGAHLGWFDGSFLRDAQGAVLAFAEHARGRGTLELPPTVTPGVRPRPHPVVGRPIAAPRERPPFQDRWSDADPGEIFARSATRRG